MEEWSSTLKEILDEKRKHPMIDYNYFSLLKVKKLDWLIFYSRDNQLVHSNL